jgi:hypothetical protein
MAGELFNSLMLNAVDEIIRRDPEYLSKQPVRTGRAAPDGSSRSQKQFAGAQALVERCVEFLRRANIPLEAAHGECRRCRGSVIGLDGGIINSQKTNRACSPRQL